MAVVMPFCRVLELGTPAASVAGRFNVIALIIDIKDRKLLAHCEGTVLLSDWVAAGVFCRPFLSRGNPGV